jgi:hypothetical protein
LEYEEDSLVSISEGQGDANTFEEFSDCSRHLSTTKLPLETDLYGMTGPTQDTDTFMSPKIEKR